MRILSIAVFLLSMAGIIAALLLYRIPSIPADEIDKSMIGMDVVARGVVTYYRPYNGRATFLRLNGLPVVFFSNVTARKGEILEIYGKVSEYRGRAELIGKRIVGRTSVLQTK